MLFSVESSPASKAEIGLENVQNEKITFFRHSLDQFSIRLSSFSLIFTDFYCNSPMKKANLQDPFRKTTS